MMTINHNDGKTSLSRLPDLEGTEEIRPCVFTDSGLDDGVKILAGSVTVTPYSLERCFSEHHHAVPTPNVQLSLPYLFR
jgi:hypothetical protein